MNTNERLQKIADFVQAYLKETYQKREDRERLDRLLFHADYRWQHTLRVAQYGKVIAESESADPELVLAACLLHDVAWFDTGTENCREHGRMGAKVSRPLLEKIGYPSEMTEKICYSIAAHVDKESPNTIEAKIVSDADMIDRFGPYRILQWCFPELDEYHKLADKLRERIKRLERYRDDNSLFTHTGKQLFMEQLDIQIAFFCEFVGENDLSIMPSV